MHSRIFEILWNKDDEPTMCNESFYPDDFSGDSLEQYGIDYTENLEDGTFDNSIKWLVDAANGGIEYDKNTKALNFDRKKILTNTHRQACGVAVAIL